MSVITGAGFINKEKTRSVTPNRRNNVTANDGLIGVCSQCDDNHHVDRDVSAGEASSSSANETRVIGVRLPDLGLMLFEESRPSQDIPPGIISVAVKTLRLDLSVTLLGLISSTESHFEAAPTL
ncbi:hypothetical protein J6590_091845 [Homalodisca vitripennis]|nr:hypothetical protein J6590_091845 [Homalodisca vitripennis]